MIEIIGKNGSGKNYLADELVKHGFKRYVGYTTRPIREGETDGIDYHFIDKQLFMEKIARDEFEEYKVFNGNYYGIEKHKDIPNNVILIGGKIKKVNLLDSHYIPIFVDTSFNTRIKRIQKRGYDVHTLFNRFHTENFSYLYDFEAIFVNNEKNGVNETLNSIDKNGTLKDDNSIISNKDFLSKKVCETRTISDAIDIVNFLEYEELCLRQLFVHGLEGDELKLQYLKLIKEYLHNAGYRYYELCDGYEIIDSSNEKFKVKYLNRNKGGN